MSDKRNVLQFDPTRIPKVRASTYKRAKTPAKEEVIADLETISRAQPLTRITCIRHDDGEIGIMSVRHSPEYLELRERGHYVPEAQDLLGTDRYPVLAMDVQEDADEIFGQWDREHPESVRLWAVDTGNGLWYDERVHKSILARYPYACLCEMVRKAKEDGVAHVMEAEVDIDISGPSALLFSHRRHMILYTPPVIDEEGIAQMPSIELQFGWADQEALVQVLVEHAILPLGFEERLQLARALEHHFVDLQERR